MELKPVGVFVLGVLGLALAILIPPAQKYVFAAMAVVPLGLLAIGQFILPRSKRTIRLWFNPTVTAIEGKIYGLSPGTPLGRLSGRDIAYSYFKQSYDFEIMAHRFWLNAGIGLVSLGGIWVSLGVNLNIVTGAGFTYVLLLAWAMLVGLAKRWAWERRMLRLQGISIAIFSVTLNRWHQTIRYHFVDPEGAYRGGWFESMVCDKDDTMTVIFYDEDNPDRSIPASGLLFHKLVWKTTDTTSSSAHA